MWTLLFAPAAVLGVTVPSVALWFDPSTEEFPEGLLADSGPTALRRRLAVTGTSAVYVIDADWVVKYQAFCPGHDPLAPEAYFLDLINFATPHIAPKLLVVSDAMELPAGEGGKVEYSAACRGDAPARVRYMVSERGGASLTDMVTKQRMRLGTVVEYGIRIFRLLRDLHSLGVVHGDMHLGNVVENAKKIMLIDFGRAKFSPRDAPAPKKTLRVFCHPTMSVWEARGYSRGYRDDVYRVLNMMAVLMHGRKYHQHLGAMCRRDWPDNTWLHRFYELKKLDNLFHTELIFPISETETATAVYSLETVEGLAKEHVPFVWAKLEKLLTLVRAMETPGQMADFDTIERLLGQISAVCA